ncbi:ATP-binding protein [Cobetia amphilecti]|uniref:ATP-binding protein n=1 Tax=Cobetia amphilecti TaxID=1055104 RepID=UPI001C09DC1E|nr:ATP-binding protein [Cobetia amphilecti]MBU3008643.1 ATP-binding protein [Cobetia amphilecti]
MISHINKALLRLPKRAEASARSKLIKTFVDVGPLFYMLSTVDHQVLYGRRGTGKTHVLNYLAESKEKEGDAVVVTDLRNIGSSSGLYADITVPLPERATRLLVDALYSIHNALYDFFVDRAEELDLSRSGPALDQLADAITDVKVVGEIGTIDKFSQGRSSANRFDINIAACNSPSISTGVSSSTSQDEAMESSVSQNGKLELRVNFGATSAAFRSIVSCMGDRQLWILLDEWSSIPFEIQPYLADLIRRSLFPIQGITVKIAAIEHRSDFMISGGNGQYTGIEVGPDASADVNLDDFMVFDNDSERSREFFQELIGQHVIAVATDMGISDHLPDTTRKIIKDAFTEKRAFEEFVRACEGVPRDGINIISLAAQKAINDPISVNHIRVAANDWYQRDKEKAVSSNVMAKDLLHWIIDEVIGGRKARAFLLKSSDDNEMIDSLYDSRVLHLLKRSISTHDQPGIRYNAFKLDYGCYVSLLNTTKAPQGLLPLDTDDHQEFVDVPPDDYRSIRRAILNIQDFLRSRN